jgi:hypothetical protein
MPRPGAIVEYMKCQVDILDIGKDRIAALRAIRTAARMSLERASRIHDLASGSRRTTLVSGVDKQVAEHLVEQLAAAGVNAEIHPSHVETPMACDPQANTRYRWGDFRTLRALPRR